MPLDSRLADLMRQDLGPVDGLTERRMFGGVAFLRHGHMVCGLHPRAAMYRVGKAAEPAALALKGVAPFDLYGRRMGGMVALVPEGMQDAGLRGCLTAMALDFVAVLPPRPAKTR